MTVRLAINGFGRIGRLIMRAITETGIHHMSVVAINDPAPLRTKAHLLRHDSVHGAFRAEVTTDGDNTLFVNKSSIHATADRDPSHMLWHELGVDIVLECTGSHTSKEKAVRHLEAGAKRVLISAPAEGADITVVYGVNDHLIAPHHLIISNASCTTNCLAPVAKVLHDTVGIEKGFMTTVHSYTSDQRLLDGSHRDLYRARAAALSIIPTSTGAAQAVGLVLPELMGKIDGISVRVPTPNVSMIDFKAHTSRPTTISYVNQAFLSAAESPRLKGVLCIADPYLVSTDFIHHSGSSILSLEGTKVIGGDFVRVMSWYDNEWGFACRMLDTATVMSQLL